VEGTNGIVGASYEIAIDVDEVRAGQIVVDENIVNECVARDSRTGNCADGRGVGGGRGCDAGDKNNGQDGEEVASHGGLDCRPVGMRA
jgi:hypothetical protein